MKKLIVLGVFVLAVASLSSCRSKKNSCTKVNTIEKVQKTQQNVVVASVEKA